MLVEAQVRSAVEALLQHTRVVSLKESTGKEQLFEDDGFVNLVIAFKKIPGRQKFLRPDLISLPHPLYKEDETDVCLFCRDPQRKYKDQVADNQIPIKRVIGISKLRAKFKSFEQRRVLCSSYDLFVADEAIFSMLLDLLGKPFVSKKRYPLPVKTDGNLKKQVLRVLNSTFLYINGPCSMVKIGRVNFDTDHLVKNIMGSIDTIASKISAGHWSNIQSIHLKTADSLALPIYNSLPISAIVKIPSVVAPLSYKRGREEEEEAEKSVKRKSKPLVKSLVQKPKKAVMGDSDIKKKRKLVERREARVQAATDRKAAQRKTVKSSDS
mmetsp:Transcript_12/g.23  ORF Transcript_12/g.23 Transcript_12/m.23 type:complete len:325 (+) Transcript_12:39-1013(+)